MKRDGFSSPQPANYEELVEALEEVFAGLTVADEVWAQVREEDGAIYAEIFDNDGDTMMSTDSYSHKNDLIRDLRAAGLTAINQ